MKAVGRVPAVPRPATVTSTGGVIIHAHESTGLNPIQGRARGEIGDRGASPSGVPAVMAEGLTVDRVASSGHVSRGASLPVEVVGLVVV